MSVIRPVFLNPWDETTTVQSRFSLVLVRSSCSWFSFTSRSRRSLNVGLGMLASRWRNLTKSLRAF